MFMHRTKPDRDEVAALPTAIRNNASLKLQLEARSVELRHIVAAMPSAAGTVTWIAAF
jgi:hypothetical protein